MAKKKEEMVEETVAEMPVKVVVNEEKSEVIPKVKPTHVSVDFPSEGLNNLARKINEIIDYL